ncbi:MAG: succinate dehydrogenase [Pseudomonadota bacterium]
MRIGRALPLLLALSVATGCAAVQDDLARAGARSAIDQVLASRFPGVDATRITPYTDCVINEAVAGEITQLAADAVTGVDEETAVLVLEIAARPPAASCLVQVGIDQVVS